MCFIRFTSDNFIVDGLEKKIDFRFWLMKYFSWFWGFQFLSAMLLVSYGLFSVPSEESSLNIPDKILHFSAFLVLSISLYKTFRNIFLLFILFFYAAISELIQFYLPYREMELTDILFNFLGIFVFLIAIFFLKILEKKESST